MPGAILDVDGTLLASNEAHARSWEEAYRAFGYDVPFASLYPLIGMGGDKLMATVSPGLSETEGVGKEIAERRKQVFVERYMDALKPTPGARALLECMLARGLKLVVASSSKGDELTQLLERAGVSDLLPQRTTSSDVQETKPSPDVVATALHTLDLQPSDVLMIGDTPYDIEAAKRAGVATIAVRTGGHDDQDLGDAMAVYDDPADILAHIDSSPFAHLVIAA